MREWRECWCLTVIERSERLNRPVSCEREAVLAMLAAPRHTLARHNNPPPLPRPKLIKSKLGKALIKAENKRFHFYVPTQTAQLLLCIVLRFIVISRKVYLYRCMHHFTPLPLGLGRVFVWVLLINHFLGQISGASAEGGEEGRWGPCSPPFVAPDGTF